MLVQVAGGGGFGVKALDIFVSTNEPSLQFMVPWDPFPVGKQAPERRT